MLRLSVWGQSNGSRLGLTLRIRVIALGLAALLTILRYGVNFPTQNVDFPMQGVHFRTLGVDFPTHGVDFPTAC